jgi:hypothetical protein
MYFEYCLFKHSSNRNFLSSWFVGKSTSMRGAGVYCLISPLVSSLPFSVAFSAFAFSDPFLAF